MAVFINFFFSFMILYTDGRPPCTKDQPAARSLPIHRIAQIYYKRILTSMPQTEFESMTSVIESAKTFISEIAATVFGRNTFKTVLLQQDYEKCSGIQRHVVG
jgi:hypothetical protein